MSAEEIARILEALNGLDSRLETVESQTINNGQDIAICTTNIANLSEQVNKMNPVWTFIFKAMGGYGNLVSKNTVFQAFTLVFWSLVLGILLIATANLFVDTGEAFGTVERVIESTSDIVDRHAGDSHDYPRPSTGGE
jgi:hypothetical protein